MTPARSTPPRARRRWPRRWAWNAPTPLFPRAPPSCSSRTTGRGTRTPRSRGRGGFRAGRRSGGGDIGLGPGTRLRVLAMRPRERRFALERGSISARVTAPPRVFVVETRSAVVTDLGCAYTLAVDSAGNGLLHVTTGIV